MTETKGVEEPTPAKVKTSHWPGFDGIRGFFVLVVMIYHFGWPRIVPGGYIAVDTFFVLSGFLITWLLLVEHDRFDRVSFPLFYARRALRLFPALAEVILISVIIEMTIPSLKFFSHPTVGAIPYVVFYIGNWASAFSPTDHALGLLSVTWSLAVEEQFYLIWPAVFVLCLRRVRRETIAWVLVGLAAMEMVARFAMNLAGVHWWVSYNMTVTHSDGLLLGCALALAWSRRDQWRWWTVAARSTRVLGAVGAVALVLICGFGNAHPRQMPVWISLAVFATLFVMADCISRPDGALSKALSWRPLVWTGKRSYGMYLLHIPLFTVVVTLHLPARHLGSERAALGVVVTFVAAGLSYWLIERPFLQRKVRFTRVQST